MKCGPKVNIADLAVGDVVRALHGMNPTPGDSEDYRQGYDAMTVVKVTEAYVDFMRPYLHIYPDHTFGSVGFEQVNNVSRINSTRSYELLLGHALRSK